MQFKQTVKEWKKDLDQYNIKFDIKKKYLLSDRKITRHNFYNHYIDKIK